LLASISFSVSKRNSSKKFTLFSSPLLTEYVTSVPYESVPITKAATINNTVPLSKFKPDTLPWKGTTVDEGAGLDVGVQLKLAFAVTFRFRQIC
jgi:hypothetical protein